MFDDARFSSIHIQPLVSLWSVSFRIPNILKLASTISQEASCEASINKWIAYIYGMGRERNASLYTVLTDKSVVCRTWRRLHMLMLELLHTCIL